MTFSSNPIFKKAPFFLGAFFLLFASLSCKDKDQPTADWKSSAETSAEAPVEAAANDGQEAKTPVGDASIRFLSYNLKNYLTMRRGKEYAGKPEQEIEALVSLIVAQQPDILGMCEIGTKEDLFDLQDRLKARGIDLPHHEHAGGADEVRHLGFLSRYPIIATNSQNGASYELEGQTRVISRGILDATIDTGTHQLRFLGVHLKSKREVDYADQELIRQNEARLLRNHADSILADNLDAPLIVYGDFNDTIGSTTIKVAKGRSNGRMALADFYFKDSRGDLWTHFWDYQDTYSRFDYVLFSKAVRPMLIGKECHIVDDPLWTKASDHRALLLVLQ